MSTVLTYVLVLAAGLVVLHVVNVVLDAREDAATEAAEDRAELDRQFRRSELEMAKRVK